MADKIEGKQPQAQTLPIGKHQLTMSMAAKLEQMQAGGAFPSTYPSRTIAIFSLQSASIGANSHGSRLESAECPPCTFLVPAAEFRPPVPEKGKSANRLAGGAPCQSISRISWALASQDFWNSFW
jgi:hypothetical protein